MSVTTIKILGTILIWLCIVFFGLLPLRLRQFKTNKTLLAISNCFSGGLFIAIGLIHVLPEAHENLEGKWEGNGKGDPFPWSYVLCLSSFSFILLVDKVIFNNETIAHVDNHGPMDLRKSMLNTNANADDNIEEHFKELVSSNYKVALRFSHAKNHDANSEYNKIHDDQEDIEHGHDTNHLTVDHKNEPLLNHSESQPLHLEDIREHKSQNEVKHNHNDHDHSHGHHGHHHRMVTSEDTGLGAYILLMAMGIHGFFAGIAFGIAKSEGETFNMFVAMIAHKWSEALTVGVSFVTAGIDAKRSTFMIIFLACITPSGVLVGYLLSSMSDTVIGVALAISAGTFIYISCAEIIIEEFSISKHKFIKFISYMVGIVFIAFIGTLEGA